MAPSLRSLFLLACILACLSSCLCDLIGDICAQTRNPSFCNKAIRSDRRSATADTRGLGVIAIDLAQSSAKSAQKLASELEKKSTDKRLKEIYSSCGENFGDAVDSLQSCRGFLRSGDKGSLNTYASAASTDADTCDDNFEGGPSEPKGVQQASQNVQDLSSVILVIANRL